MEHDFSDYDAMTFDERDELDTAVEQLHRETILGLPARPGVKR